ncbi:MAG: hypothetical protein IT432_08835 [Phycisphaerales bacterium]|nr:hypothetical protein [Phycisphaerales bacterium]
MNRIIRAALVVGISGLASAAWAQVVSPSIVREGTGDRRKALDAMELNAWSSDALKNISDWVGGKAPTSADLSGKVVLICTYSDWYPAASRAFAMAERLANAKSGEGLVVIGVHNPKEWDKAKKNAPKDGVSLFAGHDKDGKFRDTVKSDQDPDFYLVDRAGQMRYADFATESVDAAVTQLLAETTDQAAGINAAIAAAKDKADREARKTDSIRSNVDTRNIPEQNFADPTPEAYAAAPWPNPEKATRDSSSGENQGPKSLTPPAPGTCFPKDPAVKGRAIIFYVWSPKVRSSYENLLRDMDLEQKKYGRDVAVIGAMADLRDRDSNSENQGTDPQKLIEQAQKFAKNMSIEHTITLYTANIGGRDFSGESFGSDISIPWVAVCSSDGVVRWEGPPSAPAYKAAVEGVLRADPGIKARRAAEEKYLSEKK